MDDRLTAVIVFACVFGCAMIGFLLGKVLPDRHLDSDSKDIVKLATGLIATLSALVLGLLVSSAKGAFDQVNTELTQLSAKIVLLDRVLAQYGPETNEIRVGLKSGYATAVERLTSGDESQQTRVEGRESFGQFESVQAGIRALTPQNDAQRGLQSRAIQAAAEISDTRWLLVMQRTGTISMPLLVVMVFG